MFFKIVTKMIRNDIKNQSMPRVKVEEMRSKLFYFITTESIQKITNKNSE